MSNIETLSTADRFFPHVIKDASQQPYIMNMLTMSMRSQVLSAVARKNMFLSPEALEIILSNHDPLAFTNTVLNALSNNPIFVTKEDVLGCLTGDKVIFESPKEIKPANKSYSDLNVIQDTDVTGNSTCEGTIEDFAKYFQSRYATLKRIIERRRDFGSSMPINRALEMDRVVNVVGMIYSKRVTDNKHIILEIEDDEGGVCKVLISKDSEYVNNVLVEDQVIGIKGRPKRKSANDAMGMIIADEIVNPDVPATHAWEKSDSQANVAFLSDVHVGSYTFLQKTWDKMISWLKEYSEGLNLNYIVFPGDVVDGIGIFPGQEEELDIPDIYDQYETLAEYLKEIPDHIKMVVHPGNHDACRPAEPQPALNKVFTKTFDSNVIMTGNPVYLNIEGRKVLTYHGRSIDDWVSGVQQLTYENPIAVMEQMVTMRHIAPMYGQKTALAPEKKDYLVIDQIPDIFVSGHVHGAGTEEYKGIKLINASTWQDQTDYQKMHNFNPNPGIMPIVHLGSGHVKMMSFMD